MWSKLSCAICANAGPFYIHDARPTCRRGRPRCNCCPAARGWFEIIYNDPQLTRVIDPLADVVNQPVTGTEESFTNLVISHTSSVFEALKDDLLIRQDGLRRDVGLFFSLPVPKAVWAKTKLLQNQDFAAFIESSLK
jgi:hypothetical protein